MNSASPLPERIRYTLYVFTHASFWDWRKGIIDGYVYTVQFILPSLYYMIKTVSFLAMLPFESAPVFLGGPGGGRGWGGAWKATGVSSSGIDASDG